jgi:2-polyprenyl-3-methyl-5-hydroxy-6-metoxy-1,4-benzoquinol methylase
MPEIVQYCILCGSDRSALFDQRSFHGRQVTNRLCLDCGVVYQSPRMTEAESAVFYADEYRLLQEGRADPTTRNINIQKARAASLYGFVQPIIATVSRHLDIGCSMGILLQHFQDGFHTQAVGVEPGEAHREQARRNGLKVYAALEDLEKAGEARFDLVSMSHVLEHLPDPLGYLSHLREAILTKDGQLLLEVPNLYTHDSFEVAHLFAFSLHTLREVLRKSGFEILKFEKHGRPNSALLPLFLTILCRPAGQLDTRPIQPERGVALKRRIGMFHSRILGRLFPHRTWLIHK